MKLLPPRRPKTDRDQPRLELVFLLEELSLPISWMRYLEVAFGVSIVSAALIDCQAFNVPNRFS